jgi:thiamine-monophosphate kinase
MLIEESHFLRGRIPAPDLGWKSLAVNLSDIAAMGGRPRWAFLSLGLPDGIRVEWLDAFFRGWREAARPSGVLLLGGDTTRSPERIGVNVVVIGTVRAGRILFRSTARAGDVVAVTGPLGDSDGGLRVLLEERPLGRDERALVRAHHRPRPHLEEGAWLATRAGVRAAMDVSDGIDSDLHRIMERSGCGVEVDLDRLPVSGPLGRCARRYGWRAAELAAAGGEDYCLLVTVEPSRFEALAAAFQRRFDRPLSAIGMIRGRKFGFRYRAGGKPAALVGHGFDHFRPAGR